MSKRLEEIGAALIISNSESSKSNAWVDYNIGSLMNGMKAVFKETGVPQRL